MAKAKTPKKTTKSKSQSLATKLTWLPKKTFELEFSVPWNIVKTVYQDTLKKAAQEITIKGFRKGKAPLNLVEKSIDKQKLYQEVIRKILPQTYQQAVAKHQLKPIIDPKITVISLKEGQAWTFKATSCEAPEIKLNDYVKLVKASLAKSKIWTPDKGEPKKEKKDQSYDEKLKIVTQTLINNIKVELADILIEKEKNSMLSRFLDQINSLGMTLDQYLASKNQTNEQLKKSYQQRAEQTLKLEFILQAIIQDKKIQVEKQEIDKMIAATADEKIKKSLNTPTQRAYLALILAKRKALDFLISL